MVPNWTDDQISQALSVGRAQSKEYEKPLLKKGLPDSLNPKHRIKNTPRKLDGDQEAHLMALACSPAPKGHDRWTLRLLADRWSSWNMRIRSPMKPFDRC